MAAPNRWKSEWDALLGTMPDAALARQVGVATGTVRLHRMRVGLASVMARAALPGHLTIREVVARTGAARTTVESWIRDGKMPSVLAGGRRFIRESDAARPMHREAEAPPEGYACLAEAGRRFGVCHAMLRRAVARNKIPHVRKGRLIFVRLDDAERVARERTRIQHAPARRPVDVKAAIDRDREIHATIRLKNNRLYARRREMGMTLHDFAAFCDVPMATYNGLECLSRSPLVKSGRAWTGTAAKVAVAIGVQPDYLWPEAVLRVRQPVAERAFDVTDDAWLLSDGAAQLVESPDESVARGDVSRVLEGALGSIPQRARAVIVRRFGMDGAEEHTLDECASEMGVTRERVRQIEAKALRMLRHPTKANKIKEAL